MHRYRFRNLRLFFGIHSHNLDNPQKPFKPAEHALNERIKGFELAADTYKLRFRVFQVIVILASGIIPIINLSDIATPATRIISSMLGTLIVIVTGLTQMDKNHEMWILKASVEHALKHEKLLYVNNIKPYDGENEPKETVLIKRMNDIMSSHLESYFNVAGENRQNITNPTPNPTPNTNRSDTNTANTTN